jgi:hypothetical protein
MARMARMVATQVLEPLTADFIENCAESAEKKLSSSAVLDQGKELIRVIREIHGESIIENPRAKICSS